MKIPLHLILIYFLCRIHPRPTMSDEVFCEELDNFCEMITAKVAVSQKAERVYGYQVNYTSVISAKEITYLNDIVLD